MENEENKISSELVQKSSCQGVSKRSLDDKIVKISPLTKQGSKQSLHGRRRLANMLVAMVMVFATCWAPFVSLKIYSTTGATFSKSLLPFSLLLGHTHSAINPIIYYLYNKQSLNVPLAGGFSWPWKNEKLVSTFRRPPPSSTNEAALGVFHPNYTKKRYQKRNGCTMDYL